MLHNFRGPSMLLNMIYTFLLEDIAAVKHHLTLQPIGMSLDMVVLDHDDDHIDLGEELVEIEDLVRDDFLLGKEGVEGLQWTSQVTFLDVEHLEGGTLTDVIDILLIGEAVEAHTTIVGDVVLLHDFIDTLQHKHRLRVVGLHRLVNNLS